jgi:hypothetical protein
MDVDGETREQSPVVETITTDTARQSSGNLFFKAHAICLEACRIPPKARRKVRFFITAE